MRLWTCMALHGSSSSDRRSTIANLSGPTFLPQLDFTNSSHVKRYWHSSIEEVTTQSRAKKTGT